ncbi:serine/threonine-protein kinase [Treponema sp. J25]|uniref:serine/threonine-protein kinase n=1 Tax=Treponema sp. J25 TaxID=2094121 RepID=UPI00104F83B8|nr:serine/threonine-protein kinase [Treponema sp. J25]TCW61230.1 hypothetical protein C5O22_07565 [Treponema sp. J25]
MENDMWHAHDEILGTYILQEKLSDTSCFEQWVALAMYSPHRFLLRFLKKDVPDHCTGALKNEIFSLYHYSAEGIIPIVEVETVETQLVISSEYRDELPLRDVVPSDLPLDEKFLFALALRLARTLSFFHSHGLYWGGLLPEGLWVRKKVPRPEDFFFLPPGYAVLLPFLLQKNLIGSEDLPLLAPEIREGKAVSVEGDIYSLGALLRLFGLTEYLHPELFAILSRCSEPNPSQRYRSLEDMIRDLEAWGEKQGIVQPYGSFNSYQKERDGGDKKERGGTTLVQEGGYPLPQSEPRTEVLHYFQALSETYRSRYGYEGEEKNVLPTAPIQNRALKSLPPRAPQNVVLSHQEKGPHPKEEPPPSGWEDPEIADTRTMEKGGINGGTLLPSAENPSSREGTTDGVVFSASERVSFVEQGGMPFAHPSSEGEFIAFRWERNRVLLQEIEKVLEGVVRRARSGRGDLRFIVTSDVLFLKQTIEASDFWSQFRQKVRLIVIEPASPSENTLTVPDFVRSLVGGIERFLAQESSRQRKHLAKVLREACENSEIETQETTAKVASPLVSSNGSFSLQRCSEIFQDPRWVASCLVPLSTPRKPLFLMWWCPIAWDSSLASYIQKLIPFVLERPLCFWVWTETTPSGIP